MKQSLSEFVELNGIRSHVRTWGSKDAPVLFLLHGWMDISASFQFLVDALRKEWRVIAPDWLAQLSGWLAAPGVAAAGAKLYYGDDTVQHAGVLVGVGGVASHGHKGFPRASAGYHGLLHSVRDVSAATVRIS